MEDEKFSDRWVEEIVRGQTKIKMRNKENWKSKLEWKNACVVESFAVVS